MSELLLKTLGPLLRQLTEQANVLAVLCYGSYAEGTQDKKSDIDLLVICKETIPSLTIRNKIYQENQCEAIQLSKTFENWETSWTPVNDEITLQGKKVEIGYNIEPWVSNAVNQVIIEGKTTLDNFSFRPYTFLGLMENSRCLYEKKHFFTNLKDKIRPFPKGLKNAIIDENSAILDESLTDLEDFIQRDIGILAFQFHLFRAFDAAVQCLFAINEVYYPASKREEKHIMRLSKLPPGLYSFIFELLPVFFIKKDEVVTQLKAIQLFIKKNI